MTRAARGQTQLVEIACMVMQRRAAAIAIADGTEEEIEDKRDGSRRKRLKWFWLPLRFVEDNGDGTISIPEWLAKEKGLI